MKFSLVSRITFLSVLILIFALILILKLFYLQIIHSNTYADTADRQYATPSSNIFERGTIFFQNNKGQLISGAVQANGYKLAIDFTKLEDGDSAFKQISSVVPIEEETFYAKSKDKKDKYEEVAHRLSKSQADEISKMKIKGLTLSKEKWRFYPGDNSASKTIGLVGYIGDELAGRYGLERQYQNVLTRDKDNPYVNFFAEVFSDINDSVFDSENKEGDIVTTIDPEVQNFLDKELLIVKDKYNVEALGGIIMDPKDGSIYAISAKPDFNPNDFSDIKDTKIFSNQLVESTFEFGSVVKPLVMAAGIDAGVVTANTTYTDTGSVTVDKRVIRNFDHKGRGAGTSMQDVLNQSLNTGMVFVEKKLGKDKMREYFLSYGLKDKTGIDLPNETGSQMASFLNTKNEVEVANAAFGQGVAFTPVQLIRALASLSNGGKLVTPHIAEKIKYDDGSENNINYPFSQARISKATSEEITRMLVTVMDKSLKNGEAKLEHYSVAVKTGTAQVADLENGGYYEDRHTHSFFGYFPAYNPRFIVFLYAVNPKGVPYASQTWADPFLRLTKFLINYYEIAPDR